MALLIDPRRGATPVRHNTGDQLAVVIDEKLEFQIVLQRLYACVVELAQLHLLTSKASLLHT
jgi:hypothetical protein